MPSGIGEVCGGHLQDFTSPLLLLALGTSCFASGGSSGTCFAFEPPAELPRCDSTTSTGKVLLIKFRSTASSSDALSGSIAVRIHLEKRKNDNLNLNQQHEYTEISSGVYGYVATHSAVAMDMRCIM